MVALWKDPVRGFRQIPLEAGAQAVLLTEGGGRATRRAADGRWPVDNASEHFDVAVHQVRVASAAARPSESHSEAPTPAILQTDEVIILTGWAEAVSEVLAHAPERMENLMAEAKAAAPWRAALAISQPSHRLREAIEVLERIVQELTPSGTSFDTVLRSSHEPRPGESGLDSLVCGVLRSTLDQRRNRQVIEAR